MYLSIVIPAYNEASRIETTLLSIGKYLTSKTYEYEVIVVLNNCTDDTDQVVARIAKEYPCIRILDLGLIQSEKGNTKGLAVIEGMRQAIGDYVLFMDADNATTIENIELLLPPLLEGGADVAIGSRQVKGAHIVTPQTLKRRILGRIGNMVIRLLILSGIYDTQCGFKLFTHEAKEAIVAESVTHGWGFDMELLLIARKNGLHIEEVGIIWKDIPNSRIGARAYLQTLRELVTLWKRFKLS